MSYNVYGTDTAASGRPSILGTLDQVMLQVEYCCFADLRTKWIGRLYKELCLIISEVPVLDPESDIKINGSFMKAILVQEIFGQLRHDHVRMVFSNFQNVTCQVYFKKAYLRTALYNAFFELESHYANGGFQE